MRQGFAKIFKKKIQQIRNRYFQAGVKDGHKILQKMRFGFKIPGGKTWIIAV